MFIKILLLFYRAEVFSDLSIRVRRVRLLIREGLRYCLRVLERIVDLHVFTVNAMEALREVHGIADRMAFTVDPGFPVETDRAGDQFEKGANFIRILCLLRSMDHPPCEIRKSEM